MVTVCAAGGWAESKHGRSVRRRGLAFTLIELLVVIAIIALLVTMLGPSLGAARNVAKATVCKTNFKGIGLGLVMYQTDNDGYVVPSYNMTGTSSGPQTKLDGWASILDRDGFVPATRKNGGNIYACPNMLDIDGWAAGQTGTDPDKPCGYMEWPSVKSPSGSGNVPTTIPECRFYEIIRVGYWINADNPIGTVTDVVPNVYYTSSVGYGPGSNGRYLKLTSGSALRCPSRMIVTADGIYAGRQKDSRIGSTNRRVGYRHSGNKGRSITNVAFADGHIAAIESDRFPRAKGATGATDEELRDENCGGSYTIYADPDSVWADQP